VQRNLAALEKGSHANGERLAALIALVEAEAGGLASHFAYPFHTTTVRANRVFRPQMRLNIGKCLFLVIKVRT
jgi:hypothetical protein